MRVAWRLLRGSGRGTGAAIAQNATDVAGEHQSKVSKTILWLTRFMVFNRPLMIF
jgi:hypothetical protein